PVERSRTSQPGPSPVRCGCTGNIRSPPAVPSPGRPGPRRGRSSARMSTHRRPVQRRPFLWALAASLLLHAALLAWVMPSFETLPPPPQRPATRITLRSLPPRPPASDQHRPPASGPTRRPVPPGAPSTASRPSAGGTSAPPPPGAASPHPPPPDAPIQLFPGGAVARGAGPVPPGDSGASTARDVPDSPAVEGKRVLERVETMRRDNLAERLVATGV